MSTNVIDGQQGQLAPVSPLIQLQSHGLTSIGRVRASNEDNYLIAELGRTMWVRQTSLPQDSIQLGRNRGHVLLVADGMGGHQAGEVACALSITTIETFLLHVLRRFSNIRDDEELAVAKELQAAIRTADDRIFEVVDDYPEFAGMGATLTLAFISGWKLIVIHAGDCRCYLFRDGVLRQLTDDHTLVAELTKHQVLSPDCARNFRFRHVVTNAIGGTQSGVDVDVLLESLRPGDQLLLCSDGLTDMLSDAQITSILREAPDAEAACTRLLSAANAAGGCDNITAIVSRIEAR